MTDPFSIYDDGHNGCNFDCVDFGQKSHMATETPVDGIEDEKMPATSMELCGK